MLGSAPNRLGLAAGRGLITRALSLFSDHLTLPAIGDSDDNRMVLDHEGNWHNCKAEEARFAGMRRVENLVDFSDDITQVTTATTANTTKTDADTITFTAADNAWFYVDTGKTFQVGETVICRIQIDGGTMANVGLSVYNQAHSSNRTNLSITPSADGGKVYTVALTITTGASDIGFGFDARAANGGSGADTGTIVVSGLQIENATGRDDTATPSELVSSGVLSDPWHGANVDSVKYFPTENGNSVASNVVTEGTGDLIVKTKPNYVDLSGNSGSYVSTPDSAALDVTGDIEIICRASLDDWTPATNATLIAKRGNAIQQSYSFFVGTTGLLRLTTSSDGLNGTTITNNSTVSVGFSNGTAHWVRVTRDSSTGEVIFYASSESTNNPEEVTWTQLGDAVSGTAQAIHAGTHALQIGAYADTLDRLEGNVYRAIVNDGIDGTKVADWNPSLDASFDAPKSVTSSATSEVWTVNGDAFLTSDASPINYLDILGLMMEGEATELSGYSADLGNWSNTTTASATQNAVGLTGAPNEAFTVTDSAGGTQQRSQITTISADTDTYFTIWRIAYDASPSVYPRIEQELSSAATTRQALVFDPSDGSYNETDTSGNVVSVTRKGDFWYVIMSVVNASNTSLKQLIQPAYNTDGSTTVDGSAQGSTVFASCELYKTTWSYSPALTTGGTTKTRESDVEYTIPAGYFSDGIGSISFDLTPLSDAVIPGNAGIITPKSDSSTTFIYFSGTTAKRIVFTDRTTAAGITGTYSLGDTVSIKARWNSSGDKDFSLDGVAQGGSAFDDSFNPSGDVTIGKSLTQGMCIKDIKFFNRDLGDAWLGANP